MLGYLLLSITACTDRCVTCFECGGGRDCISIGRGHGQSVVGALGSELGPSGHGISQSGEDPEELRSSEW